MKHAFVQSRSYVQDYFFHYHSWKIFFEKCLYNITENEKSSGDKMLS